MGAFRLNVMPFRRWFLVPISSFLLALSVSPLRADGPQTLGAVVSDAAKANPDLAAARERLRIAQLSKRAAAAPFLPSVSVGASYDRSGGELDGIGTIPAADSYAVSATARESLLNGGKDIAIYRRRLAELVAAQADLDGVRATVSFDVTSAFARLLFAQDQLALTRSIEKRRAENVRLVGLQYDGGRENKGSYLLSKANAHQSSFDVAQAERALRVAQVELLRATGHSEFDMVQATGTLGAVEPASAPDFRALALQVPAVRSAAAAIDAARTDIAAARGDFFPTLDASGSAGRTGPDWPPKDDRWSLGVSLSIPVFQGGRSLYGLKSARAALRLSNDQTRATTDQAALDLESSYATFIDAAQRAQVQQEFLQAATVRAEIARSQYTSGLLSFNDWDIIESNLITTQKSSLTSLRDAAIAEADWERTQGKGAVQ